MIKNKYLKTPPIRGVFLLEYLLITIVKNYNWFYKNLI